MDLMQTTHATEAEALLAHASRIGGGGVEQSIATAQVQADLAVAEETGRVADALEELVSLFRGPSDQARVEMGSF